MAGHYRGILRPVGPVQPFGKGGTPSLPGFHAAQHGGT